MANKDLPQIQKGVIGLTMTFQTKISLVDTTSMKLIFKVGSTKKEKLLTEDNIFDAALGIVKYVTQNGDLDTLGEYSCQLIDTSTGIFLPSVIFKFKVVANVE